MAEIKRTQFAMQALGLAELFQAMVGSKLLEGTVMCKIELATPDGPSTGGGAQAVQHIQLVPEDGTPNIVIGSANQKEKKSELRTFDRLVEQHSQRYKGTLFKVEQQPYEQLLVKMETFFKNQGFAVSRVDADQKLVIKRSTEQELLDKIKESAAPPRTSSSGNLRVQRAVTAQPAAATAPNPGGTFKLLESAPSSGMKPAVLVALGAALFAAGIGVAVWFLS
jgi:hypothetical protein